MIELVLLGFVLLIIMVFINSKNNNKLNNVNNEGFKSKVYRNVEFDENPDNMSIDSINDALDNTIDDIRFELYQEFRDDDYAVNRTRGPMDRTDPNKTPYYHVANRLVDDIDVNSLDVIDTGDIFDQIKLPSDRIVLHDTMTMDADDMNSAKDKVNCSDECTFNIRYADPDDMTNTHKNKGVYNNVIFNDCKLDKESQDIKDFLRKKVLLGNQDCECVNDVSKSEATREEIDDYREQQIRFRDKIFGTSKDPFDAVDKMNELKVTGIQGNGQRIADVSSALLRTQYDVLRNESNSKSLFDMDMVLNDSTYSMDNIDMPNHEAFYRDVLTNSNNYINGNSSISPGKGGKFMATTNKGEQHILRDNWMYMNEKHANGGLELGSVDDGNSIFTLANDPDFMDELVVV